MTQPRTKRHILLPLLGLSLLMGLAATPAKAGPRGRVSLSIGLHGSYYSSGPYFHAGFGRHYWGGHYVRPRYYAVPHEVYSPAGYRGRKVGAISLKVKPKKTEIYVDGQPIGRSGKYDGYPGYLWLDAGTHELVFYREGFRTFGRTFEVRSGMVTQVVVEMERGEALAPEGLMRNAPSRRQVPASQRPQVSATGRGEVLDRRSEGGRIRVVVEPGEASIYLDGRFVGTGAELQRLRGGLMLDQGEHQIEAVHPNYVTDRLSFRVKTGEDLELRLTLEVPDGT